MVLDKGGRANSLIQSLSILRSLFALGFSPGDNEAHLPSIESAMSQIFIAIAIVSLISVLVLLWIRTGRRKAEIEEMNHDFRKLKGSKNTHVKKRKLEKIISEWDDALKELGGRIKNLKQKVRKLESRVTELENANRHRSDKSESKEDPGTSSAELRERDSDFGSDHGRNDLRNNRSSSKTTGQKNAPKQLKVDYNQVLSGDLGRQEFERKYEPVALGIENEEERLSREDAPVLLQEDERGQYLSIETDSGHLIVPQLNITLDDPTRRQAGYDEVFQCEDPPHNHPYVVKHVHRIARFVQRPDGAYSLRLPGRIDIQRYD